MWDTVRPYYLKIWIFFANFGVFCWLEMWYFAFRFKTATPADHFKAYSRTRYCLILSVILFSVEWLMWYILLYPKQVELKFMMGWSKLEYAGNSNEIRPSSSKRTVTSLQWLFLQKTKRTKIKTLTNFLILHFLSADVMKKMTVFERRSMIQSINGDTWDVGVIRHESNFYFCSSLLGKAFTVYTWLATRYNKQIQTPTILHYAQCMMGIWI